MVYPVRPVCNPGRLSVSHSQKPSGGRDGESLPAGEGDAVLQGSVVAGVAAEAVAAHEVVGDLVAVAVLAVLLPQVRVTDGDRVDVVRPAPAALAGAAQP